MNKMLVNRVVSFLFVGMLFLPSVSLLFSEQDDVSLTEKRRLAKLPELNFSYKSIMNYPKEFGEFFEDHFGFRNHIIALHNYIYCKLFRVSPTKLVVAGKNGWYFLNMDGAVSDYLGRIRYGERTLNQVKNLLIDRKEWLDSIGGKYLFLPVPNKEMVYEEFLPDILQKNKGKSKYDQIISFLDKSKEFSDYIDVKKLMLEHKDGQNIYHKTDSHWNNLGAFVLYCEIIRRLQLWFPDIVRLQETAVQKWIPGGSGDLTDLMNVAGKITEFVPELPVILKCSPVEEHTMEEIRDLPEYRNLSQHRIPVKTGCTTGKYKAVVFHDSFGNALKPYLTQHFKEVIYIHHIDFEIAKKLIEMERPDVVLDLRVARNIGKALRQDPELEQLVLKNKFDSLGEIFLDLYPAADKKGLFENSAINKQKKDSAPVSFPINFEKEQGLPEKIAVRLDIASDQAMDIVCCYGSGKMQGHTGKQCQLRTLGVGNNEIFLRILSPDNNILCAFHAE